MAAPEYELDLGGVGKKVTTSSEAAQTWFDRALAHTFGFNHEEAIRLYSLAIEADPSFAMGYWGKAYAMVGNYNNPGGLDAGGACEAIRQAQTLSEGVTPLEKTLIDTLLVRCPNPEATKEDQEVLKLYANEMRKVYQSFPDDVDVASMFAESLMNLAPWKLWTPKTTGKIEPTMPETLELVKVLETALGTDPHHPGLLHLYIHTMELGPEPAKALPYANNLRKRVPGQGHLVHMPSHIDMWVGQYKEAVEANIAGVAADEQYVKVSGIEQNFYKFYRMHNYHFVVWAAMFDGQYSVAIDYARRAQARLTPEQVQFMLGGVIPMGAVFLEAFSCLPWHVWVRFGKWQEILDEPVKQDKELYPAEIATAHYARGVAYAALGKVAEAEAEQKKFADAYNNPALDGRVMHNNQMVNREGIGSVLQVAESVLAGEVAYRKGDFEAAFEHLREAVRRDSNLVYDEPWAWMMPTRHALGALLTEQGRYTEAKEVFEQDLVQYKDNLWALKGLEACLKGLGSTEDELKSVRTRLAKAEERAELKIEKACYCANRS